MPVDSQQHWQRHWKRVIVISIMVGGLAGFLVSYLFQPRFTSRSLVTVGRPAEEWGTLPIRDYQARIANLRGRVLAPNHLLPIIQRLGAAKAGEEGKVVEQIYRNMKMEPALEGNLRAADNDVVNASQIIGFEVLYTDASPEQSEQMCNWLTSAVLDEQRSQRQKSQDNTGEFLEKQIDEAKKNLETIYAELGRRRATQGSGSAKAQSSDQKLARDYKSAQAFYSALQEKLRQFKGATQFSPEIDPDEPMQVTLPCSYPDSADSPSRWLMAATGSGVGLLIAVGFLLF